MVARYSHGRVEAPLIKAVKEKLGNHYHILANPQNNKSLWGVAWMSFLWSTASLMIFSLLPSFLTDELGATKTKIGIIEGVAIFTSFASKVFAGVGSDYFQSRKPLITIGTFFSALVKPMFALAASINWVFFARFIDRLSKGVRSAPTDALIADLSPTELRGTSYGMRQALYTLGAVFGAFLATMSMWLSNNDYRLTFALSAIPASIALVILITVVKQPVIKNGTLPKGDKHKWRITDVKYLPPMYWKMLAVATVLMFARFSEAFLTLRVKEVGWPVALLPVMIIVMDLVHAGVAYPLGKLADKTNRRGMLLKGLMVLILTNGILIYASTVGEALIGILLVGLHMGMTQGLLKALISEATPAKLRGTAFALFYLTSGIAVLCGNTIAGRMSDIYGIPGAFVGGGTFTTISAIILFFVIRQEKRQLAEQAE